MIIADIANAVVDAVLIGLCAIAYFSADWPGPPEGFA